MIKELITIITVNYNTSDFVEVQLDAFTKLTKNKFKFLIVDNGSNDKNLLYLSRALSRFNNVWVYYRKQSFAGSIGHAEALDFLISKVDTPYFLIMDADAVILRQNWDDEFINQINHEIKVVGAPAPRGSFQPKGFPFTYVVFFETEIYKKLNCSFMPIFGMESKGFDTGYLIHEIYTKNKFKALCFDDHTHKCDRDVFYGKVRCSEYYWPWDQENILSCHFGQGSTSVLAKYSNCWYFQVPFLSLLIKKFLGTRDRRSWISKTYNIINS